MILPTDSQPADRPIILRSEPNMNNTANSVFSKASIGNYLTLIGILFSVISSIVGITYWFATTMYTIKEAVAIIQTQLVDIKSKATTDNDDMKQRITRCENKIDKLRGG